MSKFKGIAGFKNVKILRTLLLSMDVNFFGGDWTNFMLWGRFLYECVLLREGALEGVSIRVFLNLRRMHEYETSPYASKQTTCF
jgi:hypothetical protein